MSLLGCFLTLCLLGQVWNKHLLIETEPEVKSQEQGEIEDVIESKNKKEDDTESRLLELLDEEDAEILKKMPKEEKKTVLKQVEEVFANDAVSDYQFVNRNRKRNKIIYPNTVIIRDTSGNVSVKYDTTRQYITLDLEYWSLTILFVNI